MDLDLASQVRILALQEVREKTATYRLRCVYRWYSKTFSTPLHLVPTLPFTEVLEAYFEDQFENLDEEELEKERLLIIETESQRLKRIAEEEAVVTSEADFLKFAEAEAKRLEGTKIPMQAAVRPIQHPHKA